ncbi:MAG: hypothetical protein MJB57_14990 [Gemmatimonadetes bacterium]|nr:hypothetical protein [Gemmatimonadota bacterium]
MNDYRVFGGVLRSGIAFPELDAGAGEPTWVLDVAETAPELEGALRLGTEPVQEGIEVSLFRSGDMLRLAFDDTGIFDISGDGSRITWVRPDDADLTLVRKDVFGRVLALALHQGGHAVLHGSAVELGGAAVGFIAPKLHGKSTTVSALVGHGARLLADDLIAVTPPPDPRALPGIPIVHLWPDSAERVAADGMTLEGDPDREKLQAGWSADDIGASAAPLAGLYLLAPFDPAARSEPRRVRLDGMTGALALVGHSKIGGLLGPAHQIEGLDRACALADHVPVYRLEVPRDLDRLPALVDAVFRWHGADGSGESTS